MASYINPIGNQIAGSVNIQNLSQRESVRQNFYGQTNEIKPQEQITNTINDSMVKVPIAYTKLYEQELPYGLKAHFYKLSNGQKVVIIPKEGKTVLRSYVNTGSLNEPDNLRGISHYIEHNLFNGSEGLEAGEFFKTTDKMGADTNASTGLAETNYYIASNLLNTDDLENKIKIHASMLETPKFTLDMLEKEKGIVNSEINMITSNPDNIAYNNTLKNLFNIKTTSNDIIAGTTNNITNFTRDDVVKYFNDNYFPANIVTVLSGEIEPEESIKLISKYFNSTKAAGNKRNFEKLEPIDKTKRMDILSDKTQSAYVVMGFCGPKNNDTKSRIYTNALARLMFTSSTAQDVFKPLNAELVAAEEKILAKANAPRAIMIMGEVSDENSETLLKKIYAQIEKQQKTKISDTELKILKRDMKKDFRNMFESSFTINDFIGTSILEGNADAINNYEKMIDEITPETLQQAAKEYYNLDKTSITVLHPQDTQLSKINVNYKKANNINFTGSNQKQALNMDKVHMYELPNDYRIATYETQFPEIFQNVVLKMTNEIQPKNPATFNVLNEILSNGTQNKTLSQFSKECENSGVNVAITADSHGLIGIVNSDAADYQAAHKLFKELLEQPRFDNDTFNKAKKDVRDRLERIEKSPNNKLNPELQKNKKTKEEILKALDTLTLEDITSTYNEIINNSQGICTIAAPFTKDNNLKQTIFNSISELKPVDKYTPTLIEDYTPIANTKVLTDTDNKNQAKIIMAYKFPNNGNLKDTAALGIMNQILGGGPSSRLFNDLRENQKLAYSVRSKLAKENNTGIIKLSIGTTTDNKETGEQNFDNLKKAIEGFKHHINLIKTNGITEEELEKAKLSLKNDILSDSELTLSKNAQLLSGTTSFYGPNYTNKMLEEIDKLTIEDINNTAHNVFAGNPVYSIVATKDTLEYNKEYLDSLKRE